MSQILLQTIKNEDWLLIQKLIFRTEKQSSLVCTYELNKKAVSNVLNLVVCFQLVIACVYGSIRVIAAPTVNGHRVESERGSERERIKTIVLVWSTLYC